MKVRFHGAAGNVTGSMREFMEEGLGIHGLVDCGRSQGGDAKEQEDEWDSEPARLQLVLLTHAHIDQCGRLPALAAAGFRGTIFCTVETRELVAASLKNASRLTADEHGDDLGPDGLKILMNDITWDTSWRPDGSPARVWVAPVWVEEPHLARLSGNEVRWTQVLSASAALSEEK